jgi:hypothetical protein
MDRAKSVRKLAWMVLLAAAALLLAAVLAFGGQDDYVPGSGKWEFGLTVSGAFPMGAFQKNLGTIGAGVRRPGVHFVADRRIAVALSISPA